MTRTRPPLLFCLGIILLCAYIVELASGPTNGLRWVMILTASTAVILLVLDRIVFARRS